MGFAKENKALDSKVNKKTNNFVPIILFRKKKSKFKKIIFAEIKLNHPALLTQASQIFLHLQPVL